MGLDLPQIQACSALVDQDAGGYRRERPMALADAMQTKYGTSGNRCHPTGVLLRVTRLSAIPCSE